MGGGFNSKELGGHLRKLDPNESVSLDRFYLCEVICEQGGLSGICRGGRTFGGLGLQVQPDGSSVSNIFEGLFTEEGTGSGKAIFKGGFKFSASETTEKFDSTYSIDQGEFGELSRSDQGVIGERAIEQLLVIYKK